MTTRHTLGPWQYRTIDQSIGGIDDSDGNPIGQSFQLKGDSKGVNRIANAKLMASAPELLAALEGMLGAWNMVCDVQGWERDHIQQQKDAVAAIAKATGAPA